ncbi:putative IL-18 binding protein [Sheeppox virus]|uniref:Putative IL-18 binding protein n=1 Tax=Sheeppox virus TaxID=10266 RepID=A0A5C0PX06_SHEV|nr:putative IL-18 binding protein [Sheeppox virus]
MISFKKIVICLTLFTTFYVVYSKCVKKRDLVIYFPHKEGEKVLLQCKGYSHHSNYAYVYWLIGNNNSFVEFMNGNIYKERMYFNKQPLKCGKEPRSDLIIKNVTEEIKNTNLTCVLMDLEEPIKKTLILNNIWNCLNNTCDHKNGISEKKVLESDSKNVIE